MLFVVSALPAAIAGLVSCLALVAVSRNHLYRRSHLTQHCLSTGVTCATAFVLLACAIGATIVAGPLLAGQRLLGISAPHTVKADIPFVVHDSYATQLCVSTHSGRLIAPVVVSASDPLMGLPAYRRNAVKVDANLPFIVRDPHGVQICVSTRSGNALPPIVAP